MFFKLITDIYSIHKLSKHMKRTLLILNFQEKQIRQFVQQQEKIK
jgi:hypothetical protein